MDSSSETYRPLRFYLREWRERKDLTLEQLAARVGTTKGTLSKLENGRQIWDATWARRCAVGLEIQDHIHLLRHPDEVYSSEFIARAVLDPVNEQIRAGLYAIWQTSQLNGYAGALSLVIRLASFIDGIVTSSKSEPINTSVAIGQSSTGHKKNDPGLRET